MTKSSSDQSVGGVGRNRVAAGFQEGGPSRRNISPNTITGGHSAHFIQGHPVPILASARKPPHSL
jgi:hypothetical protein